MMEARSVNAVPHLAGRRISLSWTIPGAGEFPSGVSLKRVRVVRRERTFPLDPTDGSIVYDGAVTSSFDDGRAGEKLLPITIYYYTVFTQDSATNWHWSTESQAAALASDDYSLPDRLYRMLPAIHQRDDLPLGPTDLASLSPQIITALNSLPIRLQNRGQLYRFMQALAAPANLLRSTAEALPQIQNVDLATPAFLVSLGESIDWELDRTQPVYSQRNEIRFAPSVFRTVGTVPNLRALVNRYSGWYVQVAEFAQSIARSNWPAMLNVFGVVTDGGRWRGTDDAAPALGFGLGNESAAGGISTPALLQSTSAEPFTLRPGMELAITADGRIPMAVRFRSGDFANIGAATADEVAAVINRAFSEVTATAIPTHHLVIASNTSGVTSSLDIEQATTSLVTIDGDVRGRVCPVVTSVDSLRRTRLFYSTGDPSDTVRSRAAELSVAGIQPSSGISDQPNTKFRQQAQEPFASVLGVGLTAGTSYTSLTLTSAPAAIRVGTQLRLLSGIDAQRVVVSLAVAPSKSSTLVQVMPFVAAATFGAGAATVDAGPARQQVHAKTFRGGQWGGSDAAGDSGFASAGEPAAVELSDGRIFLAWVDSPGSDASRLRFATATTTAPSAATITCNATAPFAIVPGSRLVLDGPGIDPVGFEFSAADFANPAIASLSEVLAALNTRLSNVSAAAGPLGTLELSTTAVGGDQFLQVDLGASDAASVLGIGPGNASAEGDWGDALSWSSPDDATSIGPGRYMDLAAVAVSGGRVLLVWASHEGAIWVLRGSIWDGTT